MNGGGVPGRKTHHLTGRVELRELQRHLASLAETQYGVFGVDQLAGTTTTTKTLHHLVERGSIERLGPRTYRMSGVPRSWRERPGRWIACARPDGRRQSPSRGEPPRLGPVRRRRARVHRLTASTWRLLPGEQTSTRPFGSRRPTPHRSPGCGSPTRPAPSSTSPPRGSAMIGSRRRSTRRCDSDSRRWTRSPPACSHLRGKGRRGVRRLDRVLVTSGGHSYLEREFLKLTRRLRPATSDPAGRPPRRRCPHRPGRLRVSGSRPRRRGLRWPWSLLGR